MRNFVSKIWNFIKFFPFSSYAVFITCLEVYIQVIQVDLKSEIGILFILLTYPIRFVDHLFAFKIKDSLFVWLFFIFVFLADLLILSLRTGLLGSFLRRTYKKLFNQN